MTCDHDTGTGTVGPASGGLTSTIAEMLTQQGFDAHWRDIEDDGGRLTIASAPNGRCELDIYDSGCVTCDYFPWAGEKSHPADISRAVLRLLAVPQEQQDESAISYLDLNRALTLKGAVGRAVRARGLTAELHMSADEMFNVYTDVEITNPDEPGRGTVSVTDDGNLWWECYADELTGQEREIVKTLTDILTPPGRTPAAVG